VQKNTEVLSGRLLSVVFQPPRTILLVAQAGLNAYLSHPEILVNFLIALR